MKIIASLGILVIAFVAMDLVHAGYKSGGYGGGHGGGGEKI